MRFAVLATCLLAACSPSTKSIVGKTVPPFPSGYDSRIGTCIPSGSNLCPYSIGILENTAGQAVNILAKHFVRYDGNHPIWRIVDQIEAPMLKDNQNWATEECYLLGNLDPAVIAAVNIRRLGGGRTQWIEAQDTVWAVRFDTDNRKLRQLDPSSVKCVLPGS